MRNIDPQSTNVVFHFCFRGSTPNLTKFFFAVELFWESEMGVDLFPSRDAKSWFVLLYQNA